MIAFGAAITKPKEYERFAAPGIQRAQEPDSLVMPHQTTGSIFRNYNLLMDKAAEHEDLEALVLLHQDVEIVDADFAARIRRVLVDPDVAVIGCVGAIGVRSIAWWRGAVTWAGFSHHYEELGGGERDSFCWPPEEAPSYASIGEVDSLDGLVMVLSPWAVRELRFDESLGQFHGYDFDICMQARTAGKKVVTADFRVIHHHSLELIPDPEAWIAAYVKVAKKWAEHYPDTGADPEERAMLAEAEAACGEAIGRTHWMRTQAVMRQRDAAQVELERIRDELRSARDERADAWKQFKSRRQEILDLAGQLEDARRELDALRARVTEPASGSPPG